jgi:aspartyl-tRNA(Asn)/glutamyl-tRNA(Gln) amidotransferase subunit A
VRTGGMLVVSAYALGFCGGCLPQGVPIAVKDNIVARGSPTTCGSKILDGYEPPVIKFRVPYPEGRNSLQWGKLVFSRFADLANGTSASGESAHSLPHTS